MFQSLVDIAPWTTIAQICNLLIQMLLIKKFLLKPVMKVMEERRKAADAEVAEAAKAKEAALTMKTEYEQNMAKAEAEAVEIVKTAQSKAAVRSEELVNGAKEEAAAIRAKAAADIAQERKKALNDVKNEIGGIAMDIASKVVEREINEKDHAELIDAFIRNVGDAS